MRFLALLALLFAPLPAIAETHVYSAADGDASSLLILEAGGFARVYGMFTHGVARISYDDQTKIMDNLKVAYLVSSFTSSSNLLRADLFGTKPFLGDKENEVAFVQNEPARFDNQNVKLKGDLIINGMRRPCEMDATLNKFGRINQSTDMQSDGAMTVGLSLHTSFKRSDYGLSMTKENSPFNDEAVLLMDIVAIQ